MNRLKLSKRSLRGMNVTNITFIYIVRRWLAHILTGMSLNVNKTTIKILSVLFNGLRCPRTVPVAFEMFLLDATHFGIDATHFGIDTTHFEFDTTHFEFGTTRF